MAFVSSLQVFYEMHFLYEVFVMLYTEDFSMRYYVGFSQIGSHIHIYSACIPQTHNTWVHHMWAFKATV